MLFSEILKLGNATFYYNNTTETLWVTQQLIKYLLYYLWPIPFQFSFPFSNVFVVCWVFDILSHFFICSFKNSSAFSTLQEVEWMMAQCNMFLV